MIIKTVMRTLIVSPRLFYAFFALSIAFALAGCGKTEIQRAMEELEKGDEIARIRAFIKDDLKKHRDGAEALAARIAPLFEGETLPARAELSAELASVKRPPEVIQAFVFSPVDRLFVLSPEGIVLGSDESRPAEGERNLFAESPNLEAALAEGAPGHLVGSLGAGDDAVTYLYFYAPIRKEGEIAAHALAGYALWKEGRKLTLQMRREFGDQIRDGAIIWAFAYHGEETFPLPDAAAEITAEIPGAEARREALSKSPERAIVRGKIVMRDIGVAIVPVKEVDDDFGIVYFRGVPPR